MNQRGVFVFFLKIIIIIIIIFKNKRKQYYDTCTVLATHCFGKSEESSASDEAI